MESDALPTNRLRPANAISNTRECLLTVAQVSELTGLSIGGVYHYVSQKRIPVVRLSSRCIRFRLSDLLNWFEQLTIYPDEESASAKLQRR